METEKHKSLLLILARELASNVATPMFVVDVHGVLVFYNEAAEELLGQSFSVTAIGPDQWGGTMFQPEDLDGNRITVSDLPLAGTLRERRPAHARFRITGLDGEAHDRGDVVPVVRSRGPPGGHPLGVLGRRGMRARIWGVSRIAPRPRARHRALWRQHVVRRGSSRRRHRACPRCRFRCAVARLCPLSGRNPGDPCPSHPSPPRPPPGPGVLPAVLVGRRGVAHLGSTFATLRSGRAGRRICVSAAVPGAAV